jgi:predicted DNA-binding transcriptional regulator AlpA
MSYDAFEWLNAKTVAALIGMTERWLYQRRRKRLPPIYHRMGGTVRYKRSDVEAWVESTREP